MRSFILIDPALSKVYFRLANFSGTLNAELSPTSNLNFWSDLNNLISNNNCIVRDIHFFLNFGPGSYTGLKQSKILAEVFSRAGASVSIFKQDDILKVFKFKMQYFYSSAYKNQFYFSYIDFNGKIVSELKDAISWSNWVANNQDKLGQVITVDEKFSFQGACPLITSFYKEICFEELLDITCVYNNQEIYYYRAISDDYQISFHD